MVDHQRYVASENIERFEQLLRAGRLDRQQTAVVNQLLAAARTELSLLERESVSPSAATATLMVGAAA